MRSLFWRLTATYTLTAVAIVLALQLVVLAVAAPSLLRSPDFAASFLPGLEGLAPQVRPFLQGNSPDRVEAQRWLDSQNFQRQFWTFPSVVLITDRAGRLLATSADGPRTTAALGAPQLGAALAGRGAPEQLAENDGATITAAAPVRDDDGEILGGLLVQVGADGPNLALALLASLLPTGLAVTLVFGLAAMLASLLTARSLTRRLGRVAAMAEAWGRGEFGQQISDPRPDEVGRLAAQMNRVAGELAELVELRARLGGVEERTRIARELHDSVKQQIFALNMQLGTAQAQWERRPEVARAKVDEAAAVAGLATQELSHLIQALHPPQLAGGGLAEALRHEAERWEPQTGVPLEVTLGALPSALPLPVEQACLRIAQEALANVARHSGASATSLRLEVDGGKVYLYIRDNGRRGAPRERPGGLGLRSMRERAAAVGGNLTLTHDANGTTVMVVIPYREGEA